MCWRLLNVAYWRLLYEAYWSFGDACCGLAGEIFWRFITCWFDSGDVWRVEAGDIGSEDGLRDSGVSQGRNSVVALGTASGLS